MYCIYPGQDLRITNTWLIKYGYSAINIILFSMVTFVLTGLSMGRLWRRFFSLRWLRWMGKYSYSFYVFHWIILQTIVFKFEAMLIAVHMPGAYLLSRTTGIMITLLMSYYSYNYFEVYFLSLKRFFSEDKGWKWNFRWSYFFQRQAKPVQS